MESMILSIVALFITLVLTFYVAFLQNKMLEMNERIEFLCWAMDRAGMMDKAKQNVLQDKEFIEFLKNNLPSVKLPDEGEAMSESERH